jgi:Zn-dependent M28 family amino/carboxypeptidase
VSLRDVGFYVRGRINAGLSLALNRRRGRPLPPPAPLHEVLRGAASPPALVRLLENRGNAAREAAVAQWLTAHGVPFTRHRFQTFEGRGENFGVEIGSGDRVLVLVAHHDAVPGSPGANDNAAAVAILLSLLPRLGGVVPRGARVRLLFTACEELGYLGARAYVRDTPMASIAGVLSLELCGIGDSLAVWDAAEETPFRRRVTGALEGLGLRADDGYHVVGRIPVFGSDHRAFAGAGIPAYGLSIVPSREAAALRKFVLSPGRSALMHLVRRPVPFDTYHTSRDASATIDSSALDRVTRALEAIVSTA